MSIVAFTTSTTSKGGVESGHKYCHGFRTNVLALYSYRN